MAKIAPSDRQSLLDIAVQTSGGVEAAFDLAAANDVSVSEPLEAGAQFQTAPVADKIQPFDSFFPTGWRYLCFLLLFQFRNH